MAQTTSFQHVTSLNNMKLIVALCPLIVTAFYPGFFMVTQTAVYHMLSDRSRHLQSDLLSLPLQLAWMALIILFSSAKLISETHNPFLYFRF